MASQISLFGIVSSWRHVHSAVPATEACSADSKHMKHENRRACNTNRPTLLSVFRTCCHNKSQLQPKRPLFGGFGGISGGL
jgi:hypothetical protein